MIKNYRNAPSMRRLMDIIDQGQGVKVPATVFAFGMIAFFVSGMIVSDWRS